VSAYVETAIRRVRQSPYLTQERAWLFFQRFQLEMETGVGVSTGQGSDPLVLLRWSDDKGNTWSREHAVSAGPIGEYRRRAIWRKLGRSRDRIFQVACSEPTALTLLDGVVDVTAGRR
jgi:hypothetical protein